MQHRTKSISYEGCVADMYTVYGTMALFCVWHVTEGYSVVLTFHCLDVRVRHLCNREAGNTEAGTLGCWLILRRFHRRIWGGADSVRGRF